MELTRAIRKFRIVGNKPNTLLDDPIPGGTVLEAKKILAGQYPTITNSAINGPIEENGVLIYEFTSVAATKG